MATGAGFNTKGPTSPYEALQERAGVQVAAWDRDASYAILSGSTGTDRVA